jgi:hypothetical protein
LGKVVNVGGGGNADEAINKNDEKPTDGDDEEGMTIKKC